MNSTSWTADPVVEDPDPGPVGIRDGRPLRAVDVGHEEHRLAVRRELVPAEVGHRIGRDPAEAAAVRVHQLDVTGTGLTLDLPLEQQAGAVPRPERLGVIRRSGDDGPRRSGDGVCRVDVAILGVRDQPVPGQAERRRQLRLVGADVRERGRDDEADDEESQPDRPPGQAWCGHGTGGDVSHGEPPLGVRPCSPLPLPAGLAEDVVDVIGDGTRGEVGQDAGKLALEARGGRHATCPPGTGDGMTGSISTSARISPRARCSRDLTVPTGMPRVVATSVNGSPRK